ncbi:amino acid ABC transporter permease [Rhodospirillum rubrum]|uniref:Amino acid ABC transporter, permease protein, 3-TM region, His/Glu/Gln/Arg/opine n=1 Tax=Rhodospirillum rubrum (strain ATCC 11170 / ATH 1.1.1 / DSM 467 / LMG 4362 / NCIMB 8255 / S1) TaxID=269796 RepID=Q2RSK7_RHORT|nr:amino acid ABC transporter permease [Rhodospirillum rubrum]ABC22888.1 Amino acid ABC transporter, permease protein, 3-TM region, His/Glu/Gln/Arg/opine [Rhodospirillum rubrum ATCC 11170]AEO48611.1 amino acid ABC transporter permease [Rhodospirillum rubrum F11]MBK5954493.1 amino acid ABC transporter permease [Rhodospirillum rubrum]QXG78876.1 amino acid ABC transporter permease [Rhodospirillum rubrum]HCF18923.1 amino acid ABC transporter permease [Rhodospirillum rubrum]
MNYTWNWSIFWQLSPEGNGTYLDTLMSGLYWTMATALAAWALALVLGGMIGIMRTLPSKGLQRLGAAYVEVFRNIPLLVQLFLWYFVLPELLPPSWGLWLKQIPDAPFYTSVVGIGCFTSARVAEQIRAGITTLPRGQAMASTALGLTLPQTYRYILLPMALRIVLPPLTSEFLNTVKNTSVALTISLMELTARTRAMQEFSFQVFEAFAAATLIYVLINVVVVAVMRVIEHRVAVPGFNVGK